MASSPLKRRGGERFGVNEGFRIYWRYVAWQIFAARRPLAIRR